MGARQAGGTALDAAWAAAGEAIANALKIQFAEVAGNDGSTVERSYSVPELTEATGIPGSTLRKLVASGELPSFSVTGGTHGNRVRESDWLAFCERGDSDGR